MATTTIEKLLLAACEIRDEDTEHENSALRVGTLFVNLIEYASQFMTESQVNDILQQVSDGLEELLTGYAKLNSDKTTLDWTQSPIVFLDSMGEAFDTVNGASYDYTPSVGDLYYYEHSGFQVFWKKDNSPAAGYRATVGVVYVNKKTLRAYVWDGSSMSELGETYTSNIQISKMDQTDISSIPVGKVHFMPASSKLVYRISNSKTFSWTPRTNLIYVDISNNTFYRWQGSSFQKVSSGGDATILSGTYAQAWQRSRTVDSTFCWLWVETVNGAAIRKPIWHVGNGVFIDAAGGVVSVAVNAPDVPTFSQPGGSVSANTEITVEPSSGAVLHYIVNNGTEQVSESAVSIPINQASVTIEAWCENAGGSSTHVSHTYTANAPAAPIMTVGGQRVTTNQTVPRNTVVTITASEGSLKYKVNNGSVQEPSGRTATVTCSANTTSIEAWAEQAGMSSSHLTIEFSADIPVVPSFTAKTGTTIDNNNVVSRGGYVVITGEAGGTLNYKVNEGSYIGVHSVGGAAPTAEVQITGATTIKAYNTINGENSEEVTKPYTMAALAAPSMSPAGGQLPAGGGTVEITGPAGASIYYTLDGSTPTDQSAPYSGLISVTEGKTIKAIAKDDYGYSDVTTETYTVAVDHKFQFKIKLTGDNSTEYIPVTGNNGPQYHFTVDWGDNTQETIGAEGAPVGKTNKSVGHQYSGTAGTEFTITLRGTSIPVLVFNNAITGCCNIGALSAIVDNTLDCDTNFYGGFAACTGLESICANALQNNTNGYVSFRGTALTSVPDGLLSHLTKSGVNLTSCFRLFQEVHIVLTASQVAELVGAITHVTNFEAMFYGFSGTFAFPDDFFDGISADTITTLENMTHNAGAHVSGDAKKLYDSLVSRVKSNATTTRAFNATGLSNRSQVPTTWGGSMS